MTTIVYFTKEEMNEFKTETEGNYVGKENFFFS